MYKVNSLNQFLFSYQATLNIVYTDRDVARKNLCWGKLWTLTDWLRQVFIKACHDHMHGKCKMYCKIQNMSM